MVNGSCSKDHTGQKTMYLLTKCKLPKEPETLNSQRITKTQISKVNIHKLHLLQKNNKFNRNIQMSRAEKKSFHK